MSRFLPGIAIAVGLGLGFSGCLSAGLGTAPELDRLLREPGARSIEFARLGCRERLSETPKFFVVKDLEDWRASPLARCGDPSSFSVDLERDTVVVATFGPTHTGSVAARTLAVVTTPRFVHYVVELVVPGDGCGVTADVGYPQVILAHSKVGGYPAFVTATRIRHCE